jgi:hypothetical protein
VGALNEIAFPVAGYCSILHLALLCIWKRQEWVADKGNGLRLMSAFVDSGHNHGGWLLAGLSYFETFRL